MPYIINSGHRTRGLDYIKKLILLLTKRILSHPIPLTKSMISSNRNQETESRAGAGYKRLSELAIARYCHQWAVISLSKNAGSKSKHVKEPYLQNKI